MKKTMYRNGLYGLLALALVASVGCSAGNQDPSSSTPEETSSEQTSEKSMPKQSRELVVQSDAGTTTVSLKPMDSGAELVDPSGQTLATYTMTTSDDSKQVEIKDASGEVTGFINIQGKTYTVQDAAQTPLFALRAGGDQRHRFVDAAGENVYVLRVKENGYVVRDSDKQVINKVKGGRQSVLQTPEKQPVLQSQGMSPLALAVFGFEELSQEQQGALAYAVNLRAAREAKAAKRANAASGDAASKKDKTAGDAPAAAPETSEESPAAES